MSIATPAGRYLGPVTPTAAPALAWLHDDTITAGAQTHDPDGDDDGDLIGPRRPGSAWPAALLPPLAVVLVLVLGYGAALLLWPLHAVAPRVEAVQVTTTPAVAAAPVWPADGSAALGVAGLGSPLSSAGEAVPMASITKVVTALVVLDRLPLAVGEQGPEYTFTAADRADYRATIAAGESALPVVVGESLTQYQLLEGLLIGSAGNYADYLVAQIAPSHAVYARAANEWLAQHGLGGITVVDPSGISSRNVATPAALVTLAQRALTNPVIAEIVAKPSVDLPGVGLVENTNALLGEPGVIGVKTGFLGRDYNLLAARDIAVGDVTVRAFVAVLGQDTSAARFDEARALLASLDAPLQPTLAVPEGTVVGSVTTLWGEPIPIVTDADAAVILFNGGAATATAQLALGDPGEGRAAGATAGTLQVNGPLDAAEVDVVLETAVEDPSMWWRLTHPLELLGLADGG
jgi:D-alanyl-D-alanine carboxypeptidase (penicillin-binding protein 5/6)